jgi:uncharacterized protein (TIGR03435 family)
MIAAALSVGAWQSPTPHFEEASIRPCDADVVPPAPAGARGGGPNSFQMTPGRTHAQCMTLATLIRTAYGYGPADLAFLEDDHGPDFALNRLYGLGVEDGTRVHGGPAWVRTDRYTIDAVAADAADALSMSGPMLKALLELRFQLQAHVEKAEVPAYSLAVANGGLKIAPASQGSCERLPRPVPGQPLQRRTIDFNEIRRGAKPPCGIFGQSNGPNYVWVGGETELSELGLAIGMSLGGVRVTDHTARTDPFNFVLEFVTDKDTPGAKELRGPFANATVPPAANVFLAVQQQLGLRLEPARDSRAFIVIDRVERPTAN